MKAEDRLRELRASIETEVATRASLRSRRNELVVALRLKHMPLSDIAARTGSDKETVRENIVRNPDTTPATLAKSSDELVDDLVAISAVIEEATAVLDGLWNERWAVMAQMRAEGYSYRAIGNIAGINPSVVVRSLDRRRE